MGLKYCKKCRSSMWEGTDKPQNIRKGICDYCAKEIEEQTLKEQKKEVDK